MRKIINGITTSTRDNGDLVIEFGKSGNRKAGAFSKNLYILYTLAHLKQKANVRGTVLGYFWWFIDPFLQFLIYAYIVGVIFRHSGPERNIILAVGIILWKWWSTSLKLATTSFGKYKGIATQVKMPLAILPISEVFGQTYLFFYAYILLQSILLISGHLPNLLSFLFAFLISVTIINAFAVLLSILNVFIRDTSFLVGFSLRLLFFITPIIYSKDRVPERFRWIVTLNPFAGLIDMYNNALVYSDPFDLKYILLLIGSAGLLYLSLVLCRILTPQIIRNLH